MQVIKIERMPGVVLNTVGAGLQLRAAYSGNGTGYDVRRNGVSPACDYIALYANPCACAG
ncbi:MAG: hypothetical protein ACXWIN_09855 [Burkholderiaceae bacterium]